MRGPQSCHRPEAKAERQVTTHNTHTGSLKHPANWCRPTKTIVHLSVDKIQESYSYFPEVKRRLEFGLYFTGGAVPPAASVLPGCGDRPTPPTLSGGEATCCGTGSML